MNLFCCDPRRRNAIKGSTLNGIDYVEVLDRDALNPAERQRRIFVHFVNDPAPTLSPLNVHILGGDRVRDIRVNDVSEDAANSRMLVVGVDQPGDFSLYTLRIQQDGQSIHPPPGVDPALAEIAFSFKAECPSELDCVPNAICPPQTEEPPEIDYLAKDYASFRQLMLDRISTLSPGWRDRNSADLGVALVELLAYVGDQISYQQDAIATEAYLGTARRRVSVRRHARLVDYVMHDGCNARAWVQLWVDSDVTGLPPVIPRTTPLCTGLVAESVVFNDAEVLRKADVIFETVEHTPALYEKHNEMQFYPWSDDQCCLPINATSATLAGHFPNLSAGIVLIFEEVLGPLTGDDSDADPEHRWAVRLTDVRAFDPLQLPLTDPLSGEQITEIEWMRADALPFPFCVSARTDPRHGSLIIENVSVARGNIVLVDHGLSREQDDFRPVPEPAMFYPQSGAFCDRGDQTPVRPRYEVTLEAGPLTNAAAFDPNSAASRALTTDLRSAMPAITLTDDSNREWTAREDLLSSGWNDNDFVAETEIDGGTTLRFGDDYHGRLPEPGSTFTASYRVGNGTAGNAGRESIKHILINEPAITRVRNPLPAAGGVDPEKIEEVRHRAPSAFRIPMRAVTEADYAGIAERQPGIQRAAASFKWTGSWHTVNLMADQHAGVETTNGPETETNLAAFVEPYRMAGYDLQVDAPRFVSLELELHVCAKPDYFRSDVKEALLDVLSNRDLPTLRRGLFHPDNFTFGQTVYLSPIYKAAQGVPGVDTVEVVRFGRKGVKDLKPLKDGMLPLGRIEIARLDNDPDFPDRGVLSLMVRGGK